MKKLIYTAAIMLATTTFGFAQKREGDKRNNEARAERMTARMQERLALSTDQKDKVRAIELDRIKKAEEWRKKDGEFRKNAMTDRKAFMAAQKQKMDKILTAEQKEKLKTFREEEGRKMKGRRGSEKRGDHKGPRERKGDKEDKGPRK